VGELLQHLLNGLSLGAIYALIALGYTMVYGVLKLINFAHGDIVMVGAFVAFYLSRWTGTAQDPGYASGIALMLAAMVACGALGFIIERFAYRPLRKSPRITALITAIGISLLLENGGQLLFGAEPRVINLMPRAEPFHAGPLVVTGLQLITLALAVALMLALQWVIYRTRFGAAMRAVSHDADVAALMGINVNRVIAGTFVLGSTLAAAAGVLLSLAYPKIEPLMGLMPGLKAFVAAVLGGIGNVPGAMAGGMILGLSEQLVAGYLTSSYRDAVAFAILIAVLLWRPTGLFGKGQVEKV
jgi:branched-chain amino acid transport system permease protein